MSVTLAASNRRALLSPSKTTASLSPEVTSMRVGPTGFREIELDRRTAEVQYEHADIGREARGGQIRQLKDGHRPIQGTDVCRAGSNSGRIAERGIDSG